MSTDNQFTPKDKAIIYLRSKARVMKKKWNPDNVIAIHVFKAIDIAVEATREEERRNVSKLQRISKP